jgi:23S rRNA (cytosine1962-C5)-methyltransferase
MVSQSNEELLGRLDKALAARLDRLDARHQGAIRLFNGFYEGCPDLVIDLYAATLVVFNHASPPETATAPVAAAWQRLLERLPWIRAVVVKERSGTPENRRGWLAYGERPARRVLENGISYALDLMLNQDASFYLDTRPLRAWASTHLKGKSVLNTFAYTGSLGVAARAGGASRVVHLDLNSAFLNLAKDSYALNGFPVARSDFWSGDFWALTSRLRRQGAAFDCLFLDPPFFSETPQGRVDLNSQSIPLINKVRPLVADGGWLVAVNNALYVSGKAYLAELEGLCQDGYLSIEALLPIPEDITGFPETRIGSPPSDPAPFNHATKIAILRVRRKIS